MHFSAAAVATSCSCVLKMQKLQPPLLADNNNPLFWFLSVSHSFTEDAAEAQSEIVLKRTGESNKRVDMIRPRYTATLQPTRPDCPAAQHPYHRTFVIYKVVKLLEMLAKCRRSDAEELLKLAEKRASSSRAYAANVGGKHSC